MAASFGTVRGWVATALRTVKPSRVGAGPSHRPTDGPTERVDGLDDMSLPFPEAERPDEFPSRGRVSPAEPYVDRKQLAAIMGVSVATIDRMVRAGMPSETWGLRSRRFRASAAVAWAHTRKGAS